MMMMSGENLVEVLLTLMKSGRMELVDGSRTTSWHIRNDEVPGIFASSSLRMHHSPFSSFFLSTSGLDHNIAWRETHI